MKIKNDYHKSNNIDDSIKEKIKKNIKNNETSKKEKEAKKKFKQKITSKYNYNKLSQKENEIEIFKKANAYYSEMNFDDALELINDVISSNPSFYLAYKLRADIFWRLGDIYGYSNYYHSAIKDLTKIISNMPYNSDNYIILGLCLVGLGNRENMKKALKQYQKALELSPWSCVIILDIMEVQICLEQYEQAFRTYKKHHSLMYTVEDKLIGESLVCIALALDEKPYDNFLQYLYNFDIRINNYPAWSTTPIERHLNNLMRTRDNIDRIEQAEYIQELFKEHFEFIVNR